MNSILLGAFLLLSSTLYAQQAAKPKQSYLKDIPVTVQDFRTERLNGNKVLVTWHTGIMKPGRRFELERRLETDSVFTSLGFIPSSTGKSSFVVDYRFTDNNSSTGVSYYRIKQKDARGRLYYSIARTVKGETGLK